MEYFNISPTKLPEPYRSHFRHNFSRDELQAFLLDELRSNIVCTKFLQRYSESCHENFLKQYAEIKTSILLDLDEMVETAEFGDTVFKSFADARIWDIQQKKLFDQQCLWRAERVRIPEIESTKDFYYWESDIQLCDFLTPITEQELELYIGFLNNCTDDIHSPHFYQQWQAYDEFKGNTLVTSLFSSEFPAWYEYHNLRTGNGALFELPDIRGEKEEFYKKVWIDSARHHVQEPAGTRKPLAFFSDDQDRMELVSQIEPKRFIHQMKRFYDLREKRNSHEHIEETLRFLIDIDRPVPIEGHTDWREAVIAAKNKYVNQQIAEVMPLVYEEYCMRMELGIAHQCAPNKNQRDFVNSLKAPVLEGRKLNGDPADFNF